MESPVNKPQPTFGFPDQWQPFHGRHELFFARFPHLQKLMRSTFLRAISTDNAGVLIFAMGRLCCEEFYEILTLAANGYGIGALKLLRALYERAVTLIHLSANPGEVDLYINYHSVAQRKLLKAVQATFGEDALSKEIVDRVEREYQAVKDDYLVADCARCGTKKPNHTWNRLDLVAMAKKTPLGKLIVPAYYLPMGHAHSTMRALLARIEETESGFGFNPDVQPQEADQALELAHSVLLSVLGTEMDYFSWESELHEQHQICLQDFKDIWSRKAPQSTETA